jgi:hypothetical protein
VGLRAAPIPAGLEASIPGWRERTPLTVECALWTPTEWSSGAE